MLRPFATADAVLPAGRVAAGFFLLGAFRTDFLLVVLVLVDFVDVLAAFLRAAGFPPLFADFLLAFFVAFFLTDFLEADFFAAFFADLRDVAGFLRAAAFFFDAFFFDTFFFDTFFLDAFFALTLRFFAAPFLLAVDFRDAVVFLPVPARFCFLLAAFFAGMFHSCRSEKNAELYIGCINMEAYSQRIFPGIRYAWRGFRWCASRFDRSARRASPARPVGVNVLPRGGGFSAQCCHADELRKAALPVTLPLDV